MAPSGNCISDTETLKDPGRSFSVQGAIWSGKSAGVVNIAAEVTEEEGSRGTSAITDYPMNPLINDEAQEDSEKSGSVYSSMRTFPSSQVSGRSL